jgi:hypothetical protein
VLPPPVAARPRTAPYPHRRQRREVVLPPPIAACPRTAPYQLRRVRQVVKSHSDQCPSQASSVYSGDADAYPSPASSVYSGDDEWAARVYRQLEKVKYNFDD